MNMIEVQGLRKSFTVDTSGAGSLKTAMLWWKRRGRTTFDVLKGIDLTVAPGESVALIGRNGAGKSTLLSLIAKIYRPDAGSIQVNGRLAPLLELGAGFHPDLSGAENVLYNAVTLGLTRAEARERMPSIFEFSELGEHVYAPVRTYSSGMQARLGFAVAVHVDADILLVDEVLSVGDFAFERKCHRKIEEFRAKGGTILLVSHHEETIRQFADRCLWLQHGEVHAEGSPADILPRYYAESESELNGES